MGVGFFRGGLLFAVRKIEMNRERNGNRVARRTHLSQSEKRVRREEAGMGAQTTTQTRVKVRLRDQPAEINNGVMQVDDPEEVNDRQEVDPCRREWVDI